MNKIIKVLVMLLLVGILYCLLDSGHSQPPAGAWQGCGNTNGGGYTHDGTKVFDGNAPTTFTDLDLSAYVGAEHKLVLLKVRCDAAAYYGAFRPNGDTDDFFEARGACNRFYGGTGIASMAIVETGSDGIVEWRGYSAINYKIWLLGYM